MDPVPLLSNNPASPTPPLSSKLTQIWIQPLYTDLSCVQLTTSVYRQHENKQSAVIPLYV